MATAAECFVDDQGADAIPIRPLTSDAFERWREQASERERSWVVEGCYADLLATLVDRATELVFLDRDVATCQAHARARPWEPHKYKSKQEQDQKLEFLLSWVREYYTRDGDQALCAHQAVFDGYTGRKLKLTARPEAGFVEELEPA